MNLVIILVGIVLVVGILRLVVLKKRHDKSSRYQMISWSLIMLAAVTILYRNQIVILIALLLVCVANVIAFLARLDDHDDEL